VFLLDDHKVVRGGIADLLASAEDVTVVGEAATVAQAMARIPATRPHVAVCQYKKRRSRALGLIRPADRPAR
jgi:DNA-binding NarL/FixJ family response regulator